MRSFRLSNEQIPPFPLPKTEYSARRTGEGISNRDPFVLLCGDTYISYMCGQGSVCCSLSPDLEHWSEKLCVFSSPESYSNIRPLFWAPEVHFFRGKFYLFTTVIFPATGHRTVNIYRADSPVGPFEDFTGGSAGWTDRDTIDGTFFEEDGEPWMAFVREWTCMPEHNGGMCTVRLLPDLSGYASEPITVFRARDHKKARNGVTDGPYLYRTSGGKLIMIWSNHGEKGYFIAKAYSESGRMEGPWRQEDELLYEKGTDGEHDGGHGMIFLTKEKKLMLAFHSPNDRKPELLTFRELVDTGDDLVLKPRTDGKE